MRTLHLLPPPVCASEAPQQPQQHPLVPALPTPPPPPGDYVDRGPGSLEILVVLMVAKLFYPNNIILLRGNHETTGTYEEAPEVTEEMVFSKELRLKYGQEKGMVGCWLPGCCWCLADRVLLIDRTLECASSAPLPVVPPQRAAVVHCLASQCMTALHMATFRMARYLSARCLAHHGSMPCAPPGQAKHHVTCECSQRKV